MIYDGDRSDLETALVEDTQTPVDDFEYQESWSLLQILRKRKEEDHEHGRLWAIAVSEAEKLHAWIVYVLQSIENELAE